MTLFFIVAIILALSSASFPVDRSADEQKVWSLEEDYWRFVRKNDLEHYRRLWHAQFLGWPSVNSEPIRKDHITDWITVHTGRGESLQSYHLERLSVQVVDDIATTTYRVQTVWVNKNGVQQSATIRIVHTWLRNAS